MGFDRAGAEHELLGDFAVGAARGGEVGDLALPWGQWGYNGGQVRCPAGFPVAVTGGFSVKGIAFPPGLGLGQPPIVLNWWNGSPDFWRVGLARGPFGPGEPPAKTWTVKVSVKCAKK